MHFIDAGERKHQSAHESVIFEPIGALAREIVKVVCNNNFDKEVMFVYGSLPVSTPKSFEWFALSQPDGYFVLKTMAADLEIFENIKRHRWRNLTLISEFRKTVPRGTMYVFHAPMLRILTPA